MSEDTEELTYIPESYREKFSALDLEVTQLHFDLAYYDQIFGNSNKIEILNQTAPAVFRRIQRAMLIDILMRFARLNDPKKSVGKANLSLENLAEDIEDGPLKTRMLEARN